MKGDFTRLTFRPTNHYSSVRLQQGRVQLDADWNEQVDIQAHRDETATHDVVGPCGAPFHDAGFAVTVQGGNLQIGAGRYYVDGILCENEQDVAFMAQPDQPGATLPVDPGLYFAYLDMWQRQITALEAPAIREVALGGPDTATRTKTVWQVKLLPWLEATDAPDLAVNCSDWTPPTPQSTGQLRARAHPESAPTSPCDVPPGAGFRRLENQLYRVEIHQPGDLNTATFKWSRENGSIVVSWLAQTGNDLTVSSLGRDRTLGFASDQWVELTDDTRELQGKPGTLVRLVKAEGQVLTIDPATATGSVNRAGFPRNPKVRRWDSTGALKVEVPVTNDGWIPLEDGVEVKFEAGSYQTGDYWLIPARTATRNIEWPFTEPQFPHGIRHHYCRLALLSFDGETWTRLSDCRQLFPPLTDIRAEDVGVADTCGLGVENLQQVFDTQCQQRVLRYVSGDGQEGPPGAVLAGELIVGVEDGFERPQPNVNVTFTVRGGGAVDPAAATTDSNGLARCRWTLGPALGENEVLAELATPGHLPILFHAMAVPPAAGHAPYLVLRYVGGDGQDGQPGHQLPCPLAVGVEDENGRPRAQVPVVFDAVDNDDVLTDVRNPANVGNSIVVTTDASGIALVTWTLGQRPGCHRVLVRLVNPPQDRALTIGFEAIARRVGEVPETGPTVVEISWQNDRPMPLGQFNEGLEVTFSEPMHPTTVSLETFIVTLELAELDPSARFPGHRPFIVHGKVERIDAQTWRFVPEPPIDPDTLKKWLNNEQELFHGARQLRCRVVLKGNAILDTNGERPLDGDAFGRVITDPTGVAFTRLNLPSGDGNKGGDFESWFYLIAEVG